MAGGEPLHSLFSSLNLSAISDSEAFRLAGGRSAARIRQGPFNAVARTQSKVRPTAGGQA